jgi:D-glycero-D-manno-heptose 1,7-bisphosphate phosphatase
LFIFFLRIFLCVIDGGEAQLQVLNCNAKDSEPLLVGSSVCGRSTSQPFILLDRDGTIIKEKHYLSDPDQVELLPGAAIALGQLRLLGFGLVVITNQSGIGRGYYSEDMLGKIHFRLKELLAAEGVALDAVYYCPHTPDANCNCRKPRIGLAEQAVNQFGFNLDNSFVVGDKNCDLELGQAVGATTFLVRTGYGCEVEGSCANHGADFIVDDLRGVARVLETLQDDTPSDKIF